MPKQLNLSDARIDYLYYEQGLSTNQVAACLGCSQGAIFRNLQGRGKKLRPTGRHVVRTINLSGDWRKQLNSYLRKSK
jgi:hypothetical protein